MTKMAVEMLVYVIRKPAAIGESNKHVKSMALIPAVAEAKVLCLACEIAKQSCLNGYMERLRPCAVTGTWHTVITPSWYSTWMVEKHARSDTFICSADSIEVILTDYQLLLGTSRCVLT